MNRKYGLQTIITTILIFLCSDLIYSQQQVEGKIITLEGDTLMKELVIPEGGWTTSNLIINYVHLQKELLYFDERGEKQQIKPKECKGFSFEAYGQQINMVSMKKHMDMGGVFGRIFKPYAFVKQDLKGALTLYSYYQTESNSGYNMATGGGMSYGAPETIAKSFIVKEGTMHYVMNFKFRNTMEDICEGCSEVQTKIESKTYRKDDIYQIVNEYNACVDTVGSD